MNDNKARSGIGFNGALQIAFIVLKLCKVIDWSWLWVLSPTWISVAFFFVFLIIGIFVVTSKKKKEKKYWEDRMRRISLKNDRMRRVLFKDDAPDKETKDV